MQNLLKLAAAAILLAACSTDAPEPIAAPVYRNTGAPISSIALFDPARFAGTWYEIASYPGPFRAECTQTQTVYGELDAGMLALRQSCLRDGRLQSVTGRARISGPGRLQVQIDAASSPGGAYWVLWVDEGYRTAVIGMPSGRAGWILNRDPAIPADRLDAAREILQFNGYDLAALRMTRQ